jgi:pyruvate/2-oxoglutarate dehydrogenase complex dihydrolipoamide acyltransferase (E2) component
VEATHLSRLEQTAGRVQTAEAAAETAARRVQAAEAAMATRVQAAEAATASAEARARAAETAMADMRTDLNTTTARQVVAEAAREAGVTLDRWQTIGLTNDMPLTDGGVVDRDEMRTRAAAAAAAILERGGAGVVHGFGGTTESPNLTEADLDNAIAGISFTRTDNTKVSS